MTLGVVVVGADELVEVLLDVVEVVLLDGDEGVVDTLRGLSTL